MKKIKLLLLTLIYLFITSFSPFLNSVNQVHAFINNTGETFDDEQDPVPLEEEELFSFAFVIPDISTMAIPEEVDTKTSSSSSKSLLFNVNDPEEPIEKEADADKVDPDSADEEDAVEEEADACTDLSDRIALLSMANSFLLVSLSRLLCTFNFFYNRMIRIINKARIVLRQILRCYNLMTGSFVCTPPSYADPDSNPDEWSKDHDPSEQFDTMFALKRELRAVLGRIRFLMSSVRARRVQLRRLQRKKCHEASVIDLIESELNSDITTATDLYFEASSIVSSFQDAVKAFINRVEQFLSRVDTVADGRSTTVPGLVAECTPPGLLRSIALEQAQLRRRILACFRALRNKLNSLKRVVEARLSPSC